MKDTANKNSQLDVILKAKRDDKSYHPIVLTPIGTTIKIDYIYYQPDLSDFEIDFKIRIENFLQPDCRESVMQCRLSFHFADYKRNYPELIAQYTDLLENLPERTAFITEKIRKPVVFIAGLFSDYLQSLFETEFSFTRRMVDSEKIGESVSYVDIESIVFECISELEKGYDIDKLKARMKDRDFRYSFNTAMKLYERIYPNLL